MKKSIALLALAFGVTGAFAQDLTSKKGEPILPEAGDWSVGADASPFLTYMGNFFGKTTANNAPTWNFLSGQTITVKKFDEAQKAMRASFRLGYVTNAQKNMVADRSYVPTAASTGYPSQAPQKENKWSNRQTNIMISVGMEKRKGKTRLQGYYGADVGFMISNTRDKFTYGNALVANSTNTASPNVTVDNADKFAGFNSGGNVVTGSSAGIQGVGTTPATPNGLLARVTDQKGGLGFGIGVRAFIGAEYFILPKMSLGAEFGWGIGYSLTAASKTTYETIGNASTTPSANTDAISTTQIKGNKTSKFWLDTDNNNAMWGAAGKIKFNFYF